MDTHAALHGHLSLEASSRAHQSAPTLAEGAAFVVKTCPSCPFLWAEKCECRQGWGQHGSEAYPKQGGGGRHTEAGHTWTVTLMPHSRLPKGGEEMVCVAKAGNTLPTDTQGCFVRCFLNTYFCLVAMLAALIWSPRARLRALKQIPFRSSFSGDFKYQKSKTRQTRAIV